MLKKLRIKEAIDKQKTATKNPEIKIGEKFEELPQIDFGRIAQSAKQVISSSREAKK